MQRHIARRQMRDEGAVERNQPVAAIEIREGEAVAVQIAKFRPSLRIYAVLRASGPHGDRAFVQNVIRPAAVSR